MGKRMTSICGWNGVSLAMAPRILSCFLLLLASVATAAAQLKITTTQADVPTGKQGEPYSLQIKAGGGTQPTYQYFLGSMGHLPPGLVLQQTSGVISGTPTQAGVFTFTVDVANGSHTAAATFTITINPATPPPTIPSFLYDLAHWAAFGGWQTLWSIVDTSLAPNQCELKLLGPNGQPISLETTAGTGAVIGPVGSPGTELEFAL